MPKRLQNKIAESRLALPATAAYALAMWLVMCITGAKSYLELAVFALSAYLMAELNNRNSLIRIYSRMVSCSFLVLGTMISPIIGDIDMLFVQMCFIAAYLTVFSCYQDTHAQGRMFYAFAFLGTASLVFTPTVLFVPLLAVLTATNLMTFSARNLWASLIGLVTPYWFYAGYCAIFGDIQRLWQLYVNFTQIAPQPLNTLPTLHAVSIAFILLATITGAIHFLRNNYMDKIRTRMIYSLVVTVATFTVMLIAVFPQYAETLTGILTVNASILAAHFFALTKTRITNIAFCLTAIAALAITALNIACGMANADSLFLWTL